MDEPLVQEPAVPIAGHHSLLSVPRRWLCPVDCLVHVLVWLPENCWVERTHRRHVRLVAAHRVACLVLLLIAHREITNRFLSQLSVIFSKKPRVWLVFTNRSLVLSIFHDILLSAFWQLHLLLVFNCVPQILVLWSWRVQLANLLKLALVKYLCVLIYRPAKCWPNWSWLQHFLCIGSLPCWWRHKQHLLVLILIMKMLILQLSLWMLYEESRYVLLWSIHVERIAQFYLGIWLLKHEIWQSLLKEKVWMFFLLVSLCDCLGIDNFGHVHFLIFLGCSVLRRIHSQVWRDLGIIIENCILVEFGFEHLRMLWLKGWNWMFEMHDFTWVVTLQSAILLLICNTLP